MKVFTRLFVRNPILRIATCEVEELKVRQQSCTPKENPMYALAESVIFGLIAVILGGFSLVAVAAFLIIMEGFNKKFRGLRTR